MLAGGLEETGGRVGDMLEGGFDDPGGFVGEIPDGGFVDPGGFVATGVPDFGGRITTGKWTGFVGPIPTGDPPVCRRAVCPTEVVGSPVTVLGLCVGPPKWRGTTFPLDSPLPFSAELLGDDAEVPKCRSGTTTMPLASPLPFPVELFGVEALPKWRAGMMVSFSPVPTVEPADGALLGAAPPPKWRTGIPDGGSSVFDGAAPVVAPALPKWRTVIAVVGADVLDGAVVVVAPFEVPPKRRTG